MASGQKVQGVTQKPDPNEALAHDLHNRFFINAKDENGKPIPGMAGVHLYTTKDAVPAMKAEIKAAGLPDARFQRDTKTFMIASSSLSLRHAPAMSEILGRYGVGSEGHKAWDAERRNDVAKGASLRSTLDSQSVRTGGNVDLKSHAEGAVIAGLVDQGVPGQTAALVSAENRRRLESYGSGPRPSDHAVLQESFEAVRRDPVGVSAAVEANRYESYGSEQAERLERLDAYVQKATAHLGEGIKIGAAMPHDSVDNAVTLTVTDRDGKDTDWSMRFEVGTSMPNFVGVRPETDELMKERYQTAQAALAPYYAQFHNNTMAVKVERNPMDADGLRILVSEKGSSKPAHDWRIDFAPGSSLPPNQVLLDGRPVPLKELRDSSVERSASVRALAQRLNHEIARPKDTMLFIPPSERAEFNALSREKGATARYVSNLQSGHGRPGGYILMGGDPADFVKWQGAEAHARFVKEGDEARRGTDKMVAAAREVVAAAHDDPFARYMGVGVKFPTSETKKQQWIDGYVDDRGRKHVGLKEATPEQLMELGTRTAMSYQALEREEARVRLEVVLGHRTQWRSRYDALQGSHEERIQALLPREAADKQPGFLAINHGQNRHLWMVPDFSAPAGADGAQPRKEAGLEREDKLALNSLGRGFVYLRDRYEEITGKSMGFTVTGLNREAGTLQSSVDTSATRMKANMDNFMGGDGSTTAAPAAKAAPAVSSAPAVAAAAPAAKPAARPAPSRRMDDGLDI